MNKQIPFEPSTAPSYVLDAYWVSANNGDPAQEHERLHREARRALGLPEKAPTASEYIVKNQRRRALSRQFTAFVQRLLLGAVTLFIGACALALLVG